MIGIGEPRFDSKIQEDPESGCWVWTAGKSKQYAKYSVPWPPPESVLGHRSWIEETEYVNVYAHRYAYVAAKGPIPERHQIDHLCRNKSCVNPRHLEVVTQRENIMRSNSMSARWAARTHCEQGHPFSEENTRFKSKGRVCVECDRVRQRERYRAKREAEGAVVRRIRRRPSTVS